MSTSLQSMTLFQVRLDSCALKLFIAAVVKFLDWMVGRGELEWEMGSIRKFIK